MMVAGNGINMRRGAVVRVNFPADRWYQFRLLRVDCVYRDGSFELVKAKWTEYPAFLWHTLKWKLLRF